MKKYLTGVLTGLILATTTFAFAAPQAIKLIVDGKELKPDVPPQVIKGRTLVPARPLAEALGAKVAWDAAKNAVVVSTQIYQNPQTPSKQTVYQGEELKIYSTLTMKVEKSEYVDSYKPEFLPSRNGEHLKPQNGTKMIVLSLVVKNPTDKYQDLSQIAGWVKILSENDDGRKWHAQFRDMDSSKLSEQRYLAPGDSIATKLIGFVPDSVNLKVIIPKTITGTTSDIIINTVQP